MDHFRVPREVADDAVVRSLEASGIFAIFIDHAIRMSAGGVDEADVARVGNDEKGDVFV